MDISLYDYKLPEELIAQRPAARRDESRLLVLRDGDIEHKRFTDVTDYISDGDVVVFNDSKVIKARLAGVKESTGAGIELLLLSRVESFENNANENGEGDSINKIQSSATDSTRSFPQDSVLPLTPDCIQSISADNVQAQYEIWETLAKPAKRLKVGDRILFGMSLACSGNSSLVENCHSGFIPESKPQIAGEKTCHKVCLQENLSDAPALPLICEVLEKKESGSLIVRFAYRGIFLEVLDELGKIPLPPYIRRDADESDDDRYQTVYSKVPGSVAAPTAGLHFTDGLLTEIKAKGAETVFVTLHVGLGTFRPVKTERIEDHQMHVESYYISEEAAKIINAAKREGRRVICVGTTAVRTLESAARGESDESRHCSDDAENRLLQQTKNVSNYMSPCHMSNYTRSGAYPPGYRQASFCHTKTCQILRPPDTRIPSGAQAGRRPPVTHDVIVSGAGETDIFIYPGFRYRVCDALITNFHLPKSTLLMLVSALAGRENILNAYEEAVRYRYRFFSYGDAMFIF